MRGAGLALLSIVLFSAGCQPSLFEERVYPVDVSAMEEVLSSLNVNTELMETFRSTLTVQVLSKGARQEVRCYLRYKRPRELRVDVLGVLNELRAVMTASKGRFTLILVPEKRAVVGELSDEVIEEIFGVKIRVSDVRSAILANPLYGRKPGELEVGIDRRGRYLFKFKGGKGSEKVWVEPFDGGYVVTKWSVHGRWGREVQEMRLSGYRRVGGILRPTEVRVSRPDEGIEIRFRVSDPRVNEEIPDSIFQIEIPPGVSVRELR